MKRKHAFWFSLQGLASIGFIGAVSYFLLVEHRQHLFALLPYLILLACPLMHVLHGRHHHGEAKAAAEAHLTPSKDDKESKPRAKGKPQTREGNSDAR
ncbi:DUF2933 domain-containing protein [Shewanella salipaludis]|uniref:DUF2933 domain-containing protein n=1 Tax=Shewanella salipaludis TaxID=2723052 RepID=A0A972FYP1_9GAMM|nr:DUF2933 domain-containing protein [Shewanella salipaludis]NMH63989.1 DUF2933 domain-containing protein [Shewanella salipaludis]